uniref:Uncharacterized protein n=1 Tax=Physcomitrium patens TaxID=3218 RepID=A0A2K1J7E5_PHYPA|nr:hypothetical protein PHYPA_020555 [Physcomitrium patens]
MAYTRRHASVTPLAFVRSIACIASCSFLFRRLSGLGGRRRSVLPLPRSQGSTFLYAALPAHTL